MSLDVLKKNLAAFVRSVMAPVDYYALYPAKVVRQDATNLLLELQPDDPRLPGMQKVPIRLGIPQATAKVSAGARGLVGFEGGDPRKPFWGPWDTTTLLELKIGGTGAQLVALENLVKTELTKLKDWQTSMKTAFDSHKHSLATPGTVSITTTNAVVGAPCTATSLLSQVSGDTAAPSSGAPTPAAVGDVKAEKVWVK